MKNQRYKRRKKTSLKRIVFAGLFFCFLAGLAYFIIWLRYLQVEEIEVVFKKHENIGVWCQIEPKETATSTERQINQCFYFDSEGIIFRQAPLIKGSIILNVYGIKDSIKIMDEIMSPEMVEFITAIKQGLTEKKAVDFEIISPEDLRATTVQGWQIYFNPAYSAGSQLDALKMVLEEEIKQDVETLEYIDLRIQGRVYYK